MAHPDFVLFERVIVEVKLTHVLDAREQLCELYLPLMELATGRQDLVLAEVCKNWVLDASLTPLYNLRQLPSLPPRLHHVFHLPTKPRG